MPITVGQPAPAFSLYNSSKELVSLADQAGKKVLLLFFPFAFSSVCTAELCAVRDSMGQYESLNAEIFGVSVDSLYCLAKFKEDKQLGFQLLSDFNKEVSASYGALYETFSYGMRGVSKRAAFIVDPGGIIRYAEVLENSGHQPDFDKIRTVLESISKA
jgi:peroxiredoxin